MNERTSDRNKLSRAYVRFTTGAFVACCSVLSVTNGWSLE